LRNPTAKITAAFGVLALLLLCSTGMAQPAPTTPGPAPATTGSNGRIQEYETVFSVLSPDGIPQSVTVVDWIRVPQGGLASVFDPGDIQDPVNLRNAELPEVVPGGLRWSADPTRITDINYSGASRKELPIGVKVTYRLNGQVVPSSAVSGSSGRLEVTLAFTNRTAREEILSYNLRGENITFAENVCVPMIVQVSTEVALPEYRRIEAPDATTVLAGKSLNISWMTMPSPDASCTLVLEGDNINLSDFDITVIPSMPPIPELEELLDTTIDALGELESGVDLLDSAVLQAASGAEMLADGQKQVAEGMRAVEAGLSDLAKLADGHWTIAKSMNDAITPESLNEPGQFIELVEAAKPLLVNLSDGISAIMSAIPMDELGQVAEFAPKLLEEATDLNERAQRVSKGLSRQSQTISQARTASTQSLAALQELADSNPGIAESPQFKKVESSLKKQNSLLDTAATGGRVGLLQTPSINELAEDAKSIAATGSRVKIVVTLASTQIKEVSFDSIDEYAAQAMEAADLLNALLYGGVVQDYEVPSIDQICDGLRTLDQGLRDLKTGLGILAEGGSVEGRDVPGLDTSVAGLEGLAGGVSQLSGGMADIEAGSHELAFGLERIRNEGTCEMKNGIGDGLADALESKAQLVAMKVRLDQYDAFEGKPAGAASEVRFLMKLKAPSHKE